MQYQIRYIVQKSEDGVLWHDVADCASEEEAEEEMIVKQDRELRKREHNRTSKKEFEVTLVLRAGCDTNEETETIKRYMREGLDAEILSEDNTGIKKLCYTLDGEARAEFRYIYAKITNIDTDDLSSYLNRRHNVLRYLIIRTEDKHPCLKGE